ncbi:hypothetical protein V1502_11065 [Bacillus sp. SCS-153A]|uniref:hypothetical protein n=1 Tax=Rossellomorea sedimentorum TaxID=3115294 RepID=UPI0039064A93
MLKQSKSILLAMVLLPFLSIPLLGKESIKRYLPSGIFILSVVAVVSTIAHKRKWWWFYVKLHPKVPGIVPLMGPFLIGSMWIMKFTYGKFFQFTLLNMIVDSIFTFVIERFLKKFGLASLVRLKKIQLSLILFIEAWMLYGFQFLKEKYSNKGMEY